MYTFEQKRTVSTLLLTRMSVHAASADEMILPTMKLRVKAAHLQEKHGKSSPAVARSCFPSVLQNLQQHSINRCQIKCAFLAIVTDQLAVSHA